MSARTVIIALQGVIVALLLCTIVLRVRTTRMLKKAGGTHAEGTNVIWRIEIGTNVIMATNVTNGMRWQIPLDPPRPRPEIVL